MSPRWAQVGPASLYFYASEPHRRPHVDVVGPGWSATVALDTLEVMVSSGRVPPKVMRRVTDLLVRHQDEAIAAFQATLEHHFPGKLGPEEGET